MQQDKVIKQALFKALKLLHDMIKDPKGKKLLSLMMGTGDEGAEELISYAYKNKVLLLFYQLGPAQLRATALYRKLIKQRKMYDSSVVRVADVLNACSIKWAFFKVRPLPDAPADIDVLIPSWFEVRKALMAFKKSFKKVVLWDVDRYSLGMRVWFNDHYEVVEFYVAPHVSNIVYLDASALISEVIEKNIDGHKLRFLTPEAEAITLLAHCICKEQLITLSDAISILTYLLMSDNDKLLKMLSKLLYPIYLSTFFLIIQHASAFPVHLQLRHFVPLMSMLSLKKHFRDSVPHFITSALVEPSRIVRLFLEHMRRETYVRGLSH
jgi:hypothetical protein